MKPRPPIVAILGHVDHGKTSLLDYIRKAHVADGEYGGITQHIGAYEIDTHIKGYATSRITFIDTPGHEAFSQLRSRGAHVADIAILLIDGKDSLMPQTIESIAHIKKSGIPFIVAISKSDLPDSDADAVYRDLLRQDVQVESQGGKVPTVKVSSKTGLGIPDLLENILYMANEAKLAYDPDAPSKSVVIEVQKDKRGIVTSIICLNGSLKVADTVYADNNTPIKIRALISDTGTTVKKAEPSMPVQFLGANELPVVGTYIQSEKHEEKEAQSESTPIAKVFDINALLSTEKPEKKLSLILKVDTQGSYDALVESLGQNPKIELLLTAIGEIATSDIFLAKTTGAVVVGFNTKPSKESQDLANQEKVVIKTYNIIYELLDELEEVTTLIAEKEQAAKSLKGEAKVLAQFEIEGEKVYGLSVMKGKFTLGDEVRVVRSNEPIGKTKLVSLKIRAKPVKEVKKGEECGMVLSPPLDIRPGDMVQSGL